MPLAKKIKELDTKGSFEPKTQFIAGHRQRYRIEMKNAYLNPEGNVVKRQELVSTFSRCISEVPLSFLAVTDIDILSVEFVSKEGQNPMRWTFAEGLTIPHYIFIYKPNEELKKIPVEDMYGLMVKRSDKFNAVFSALPKLPSVFLFIMQAYDILGFEFFASCFGSTLTLYEKPGHEIEIRNLSFQQHQIGMGLYSESSFFKNGAFFAMFLGYSMYGDKACCVFEYRCDESKVSMGDKNLHFERDRQGNSYYSGLLYLDVETGLPVMGTMLESFIAVQNKGNKAGLPEVPVHVRRRIRLELLGDGGAVSQ